jgi:exodeoxyribonuclease V alpha subunit
VTFHNPENGFCVLRVKARGQRDLITVLGHAAMISAGEFVQVSGTWINDVQIIGIWSVLARIPRMRRRF